MHSQAKSTFAETPHKNDLLLKVEEEDDSINQLVERGGSEASIGLLKNNKCCSDEKASVKSEEAKFLIEGTLLKKGLFFYNKRHVKLDSKGTL